MGIEQDCTKNA